VVDSSDPKRAQRANIIISGSSLALNNLRGMVILIVVAFHSVSAYLGSLAPSAYAFDKPPYLWRAFPIVDTHRWFGFDLFCAWQDCLSDVAFLFPLGPFRLAEHRAQGSANISPRSRAAWSSSLTTR